MQMADFGLSRVLEANATHVSTFTYGEQALHLPDLLWDVNFLFMTRHPQICVCIPMPCMHGSRGVQGRELMAHNAP